MKRPNTFILGVLLANLLHFSGQSVMAQEDYGFNDEVLKSEPMDIDGAYSRRNSQAEKLEKMRKELERKNENLVKTKIEDRRMDAEKKLTSDLKNMFNGGVVAQDQVETQQAAPAPAKTVAKAPEQNTGEFQAFDKFKIIPFLGMTTVKNDNVNFDSSLSTGVAVESMVHERVSVGMGLRYTKMAITGINSSYYAPNYFQARSIDYRNLGIGMRSRFFIVPHSRVRPYVGAGLEYSMVSMEYDDIPQGVQSPLGQPRFSANYMAGSLLVGSEIVFSENVGLNVEFNFTKGLSSANNREDIVFVTQDQQVLNQLGGELTEASLLSLHLGLVITF